MGLGHGRQRAGALLPEALRISHGIERAHPSNHAESGRKRDFPHRGLHRLPATETRIGAFARSNESAGGGAARPSGCARCELFTRPERAGSDRFEPGVIQDQTQGAGAIHMKRTCWTLSIAALAIVMMMMAGRARTFAATAVEDKPATEV